MTKVFLGISWLSTCDTKCKTGYGLEQMVWANITKYYEIWRLTTLKVLDHG
jgi:hypothetical protein